MSDQGLSWCHRTILVVVIAMFALSIVLTCHHGDVKEAERAHVSESIAQQDS